MQVFIEVGILGLLVGIAHIVSLQVFNVILCRTVRRLNYHEPHPGMEYIVHKLAKFHVSISPLDYCILSMFKYTCLKSLLILTVAVTFFLVSFVAWFRI